MLRCALALAAIASFACAEAAGINRPPPGPQADAGAIASGRDAGSVPAADASPPFPPPDGVLREDFGHRDFVESSSVAIIDVNHGWATLPASAFPPLDERGVRTLSALNMYNGLVAAGSIVVLEGALIDASDSIELRARETLNVSGHIRAGAGGVHLVAGSEIIINGIIESAGPITLQLANEDGVIEIAGRLATVTEELRGSGAVSIEARGRVEITGVIETGGGRFGDAGDITILAYGDVSVLGPTAALSGGTSAGGAGGTVEIVTEGHIAIGKSSFLRGGDGALIGGSRVARGGDVLLRGGSIRVADPVRILGGRTVGGEGGAVSLKSAGAMILGRGVEILGGAGSTGGTVSFEARTATAAAEIRAGDGDEHAGRILLTVAGPLNFAEGTRLVAGDGVCAAGGDVVVLAAGVITLPDRGATLTGGRGGTGISTCFGDFAGGSVRVVAHAVSGPLDQSAEGGDGVPPGVVSQSLDRSYSRVAPDIRARTAGWITSRAIPRLAQVMGLPPKLLEMRATVPEGTSVALQIADGELDPPQWIDVARGQRVPALSNARSIRYRLSLEGRALDAPIVDGFDLALGL